MSGPVVPSGADFDEERDLGAHRSGRLSRLIGRVRSAPKRPTTTPAQVENGVGESLRVASFAPPGRPGGGAAASSLTATSITNAKENPVPPAASPRRARKRVVVDDIIPSQPVPTDDSPYKGNWDHSRGSQKNVRDELDPSRDISYYDD